MGSSGRPSVWSRLQHSGRIQYWLGQKVVNGAGQGCIWLQQLRSKAGSNKCFNCLSTGHHIDSCRDPPRCLRCLRFGHKARYCPASLSAARFACDSRTCCFSSASAAATAATAAAAPRLASDAAASPGSAAAVAASSAESHSAAAAAPHPASTAAVPAAMAAAAKRMAIDEDPYDVAFH
jgi:hypothetical protein